MKKYIRAMLLAGLPGVAFADGVEWNYEVARQCAELTQYIDELSTLAGVQRYERVEQTAELAKLRQGYTLTYTTSQIVLGHRAIDVLSESDTGLRSLERKVLSCVRLGDCEPEAVHKSAQELNQSLVEACQKDFRGSE